MKRILTTLTLSVIMVVGSGFARADRNFSVDGFWRDLPDGAQAIEIQRRPDGSPKSKLVRRSGGMGIVLQTGSASTFAAAAKHWGKTRVKVLHSGGCDGGKWCTVYAAQVK